VYLDDILTVSESIEEHISHLKEVLQILSNNNLHLNLVKSKFFQREIEWVGHTFCADKQFITIHPQDDTTKIIQAFPPPRDRKSTQKFLGHLTYVSKFIPHFTDLAHPLYSLCTQKKKFCWIQECQMSFEAHKLAKIKHMQLYSYQPELPIKISTNARDFAISAVLWQRFPDTKWHPIGYCSRSLIAAQREWSPRDRELFAIRIALRKFKFHLTGQRNILVETDHKNILAFIKEDNLSLKLSRWKADMLGYDLTFKYLSGTANTVADYSSRYYSDISNVLSSQVVQQEINTTSVTLHHMIAYSILNNSII